MDTTIQVSRKLLEKLAKMKMHEKESYENVIWDLLEDRIEFSEQTKKAIEEYEKDIKAGRMDKFTKLEDIKKEMEIDV